MELTSEISAEQLPLSNGESMASLVHNKEKATSNNPEELESLSDAQIAERVETILLDRIKDGNTYALFQLGQLYFEQGDFDKARTYFERSAEKGDFQAMFQLGVIFYDGLAGETDHKSGVDLMQKVASSTSPKAKHLLFAAYYNIGRAYFQGYGVQHLDDEAERYWLLAADDGNPMASVKAQTMLGMYYCRTESSNLKKAFFWHSEACGNGSLESQGALGVMYLFGLGTKKDPDSAFICLREAASRGNVYAMGNLITYYYRRKLYTKTSELAARVSQFEDVQQIASETDCLPGYVAKGIAIACFYYARCLSGGHGVKVNEEEAKKHYSKSYMFDPDVCAQLQNITTHGVI